MAAKTKQEPAVQETKAEKAEVPAAATKFELARLRKDCLRLFGVTVSTFDGATFGLTGRFTVEEMRNRINKWKNARVIPARKKEAN